ncbi:glycoside hydrolase family protein [Roseibium sediminis]|uniref:glycoside hydrolase family protein n=1 Tax=Roseibium sediminis TaxID=1775174 RepID=UPI00123CB54A|nr:peptidoglycan-binding protein [Roseibium sediminis]
MRVSERGLAFIAGHEGFVSRAYLDPAGVLTIGYGFTMKSRVFAQWWRVRHDGSGLVLGDTLSREDANTLLMKLLDEEYAPPVERALPGLAQPLFDACVSIVYNLGPRALSWKWATALKAGKIGKAADLLARTGTTAGGRKLAGLVRRRIAEARLLQFGDYGLSRQKPEPDNEDILDLQKSLRTLGFDPGPVNGSSSGSLIDAIRAFQQAHPPLLVDGIAGPATRARIARALASRKGWISTAGGAVSACGVGLLARFPLADVLAATLAIALIAILFNLAWRHRGRFLPSLSFRTETMQ